MKILKKLFSFFLATCYLLHTTTTCLAAVDCWSNDAKQKAANIQDLECVFTNILSLAIPAAGITAFIMLLVGGFKYLTSGGDPKQSQAAQQTITYAVIGLILLVSAYIIINFISTFTGVEVGTFIIPK